MAQLITPQQVAAADRMSRCQWSVAAAIAMLQAIPEDVRLQMVLEGPERFEGVARGALAGHAFHQSDYRRMFRILKVRTLEPERRLSFDDMEKM